METPKSLEERKEELINGVLGENLKGVGFIVFQHDANHPDLAPDEVYFDLQRPAAELSKALMDKIIADAEVVAASEGYSFHSVYRWVAKGGFNDANSMIQICIKV